MQSASVPSTTKSAAGNPHDEIRRIKKTEGGKNLNTIVLTDVDFYPVIQPILEILDAILWPAIAIVVAVGTIYCIFLGVKISKADEQNSREKAKKDMIGAVIGFIRNHSITETPDGAFINNACRSDALDAIKKRYVLSKLDNAYLRKRDVDNTLNAELFFDEFNTIF